MQRRLLTPIALVAVVAFTVATPAAALAKGATSVTVTGPGLVAKSFDYTRAPHDVDLDTLAETSGIYRIFGVGQLGDRPSLTQDDLGPRYVLTWHQGSPVMVVSHVYPFARGGAWAHVPPGQRLYGERVHAGWYRGGSALEKAMVRIGAVEPVERVVPVAADTHPRLAGGEDAPAPEDQPFGPLGRPGPLGVAWLAAAVTLAAAGWLLVRRRGAA